MNTPDTARTVTRTAFGRARFGILAAVLIALLPCAYSCVPWCIPWGNGDCDEGVYKWWRNERTRRQAEIDAYLADNRDEFDSFRTAPLGIKQGPLNAVGIQMIVFRLMPEIFPEIWGPPEDKLSVVGFGPDPFDPTSVMPLGQGYALSATFSNPTPTGEPDLNVNYATFTCMGCHSGGVVGPDGEFISLIGGPTPTGYWNERINTMVNDPNYTAATFRTALSEKPPGWVYGDLAQVQQEILERALFQAPGGAEYFLTELKVASNASAARIAETLMAFTYNIPNPPLPSGMPGSIDVFGLSGAMFCDPNGDPPCDIQEVLPLAPAPSDIAAVWEMGGRPRFQWDNSVGPLVYRSVLVSLTACAGDAAAVNMDNVLLADPFIDDLPAPPYPFDVEQPAAERGAQIFQQACESCHSFGTSVLATPEGIGTDPNRANVLTDAIVAGMLELAHEACDVPECFDPNGDPPPDSEILTLTMRYSATPLDGIWATSPYLHNGSVPTLYHLLTGERPATFFRGNRTYDEQFVGFTWDSNTNPDLALLYDTSLDGCSNTGHTGPEYNGGIDWTENPGMLWDLLEYLKTR